MWGNAGACVFAVGPPVNKPLLLPASLPPSLPQDIGEAETHELEGLYKPLLGGLLEAVLSHADLSSQGIQLAGLNLQQLVRQAGRQAGIGAQHTNSPNGGGLLRKQA